MMALNTKNFAGLTGFTPDLTVSLEKDFEGNSISNNIISSKLNCPRRPISQDEYNSLALALNRCIDSKGLGLCKKEEHNLNQYLKIDNIIDRGLISSCENNAKQELQESIAATAAAKTEVVSINNESELGNDVLANGQAALGTLLLPYLYIRWGETVLHNSFPSFLLDKPTPQIRNNVAGFEITIDTNTSGGEESGGSGSESSGVSTCELTLNPHLVDENGDSITIQTDGAELLLIYGYPNSNQVRTHTFAQVGVKDSFFNEQKTQLSFRGRSWKLSRLSEQKRYPSGKLKERVLEVGRQICKSLGYVDTDCEPVAIDPPNALDDIDIGETSQSGSITDYMARLVEHAAGCTFHQEIDRTAYSDSDRTKLKLSINCQNSLNDELDAETNLVLVDRALWLGQGLAERVELSDVGDTASSTSNTGGNCGGSLSNRKARPRNLVLRTFNKGCDYRVLNRSQITNVRANTANEFVLKLSLDGDIDVAILSPFNAEVIEIGPDPFCSSTSVSDTKCGGGNLAGGSGNFVKLKAKEPSISDLSDITWTFYYLAGINVSVGDKVTPGQNIATQGSSGSVENNILGIRIERDGEKIPEDEGLVFVEDYIDTITFPCSDLRESCIFNNFVTSGSLQPGLGGAKYHIHYETYRGLQDAVAAFDNMANIDSDTCYNLNQIINGTKNVGPSGSNACWNTAWDNKKKTSFIRNCSKSHSHSPPKFENNIKCDFWVFDKKTEFIKNAGKGRSSESAKNRPIANPYPEKAYRFIDTNAGPPLGSGVIFSDSASKPPTNTLGFDPTGNGFAQMLHGDSETLGAPKVPGGPVFEGCSDSRAENIFNDSSFESVASDSNEVINTKTVLEYMTRNGFHVRKPPASEPDSSFATNIVGIRGINPDLSLNDDAVDKWNDLLIVFGLNNKNVIKVYSYSPGTTQPAKYYIDNTPYSKDGAAMMIPDKSYRGIWKEGSHICNGNEQDGQNKCIKPALVQAKPITITRDLNKDNKNTDDSTFTGNFGINFHHSRGGLLSTIDMASAGCQVYFSNGTTAPWTSARKGWQSDYLYKKNNNSTFDYVLISGSTFASRVSTNDDTGNEFLENNITQSTDCGPNGTYNMTQAQADTLNNFCKEEGCNPKDIAAFIQAECGWNLNNTGNPRCSGAFQCCTPDSQGRGAPEAKMRSILEAQGETFFKTCNSLRTGQPLENHLKAWKAYKQASVAASGEVPINAGLCANYVQIALPALVPLILADVNANFKEACTSIDSDAVCRSYYSSNQSSWFAGKSYENASLSGICKYARTNARNDNRLEGGCNFNGSGAVFNSSESNGCSNESSNRSLNSRNTGTLSSGGLRNLKFRQEIRLNAEFGICPRNVFLSPTDTAGKPKYILLANMDNSAGFADFKIRSVTLSWQGSWRWSVTAFRPATNVTFETPPTLIQPQTLNEWINYYWFLDRNFLNEASQFAPAGTNARILSDGTLDPNTPIAGSALTNEAIKSIESLINDIENSFYEENKRESTFTTEQAERFESKADAIQEACSGIVPDCLNNIQRFVDSESFEVFRPLLIKTPEGEGEINMAAWFNLVLIDNFKEVADFTSNI